MSFEQRLDEALGIEEGHWKVVDQDGEEDYSFIVDPDSRYDKQELVPVDSSLKKESEESKAKKKKPRDTTKKDHPDVPHGNPKGRRTKRVGERRPPSQY